MLLVLLARIVRTWKQALFIVQAETRLALASSGFQALLEIQVEGRFSQAKDLPGNRGLDQADGEGPSPVGSRAHPGRIAQAGHTRRLSDHAEVHERRAHHQATRTEVEHVLTDACPADLGVRPSAYHRSLLPFAVCLLHHPPALAQSDPRGHHTLSHRLYWLHKTSVQKELLCQQRSRHSSTVFANRCPE